MEFAGSEVVSSVELLKLVLATDGVDDVVDDDDAPADVMLSVEVVGVVLSVDCVVVGGVDVVVGGVDVDVDVTVGVPVVVAVVVVVDDDEEVEVEVTVLVKVDAEVGLAVEVVVVGFPNPRSQPAEKL